MGSDEPRRAAQYFEGNMTDAEIRQAVQSARNVLLNHARHNPTDRTCTHEAEKLGELLQRLDAPPIERPGMQQVEPAEVASKLIPELHRVNVALAAAIKERDEARKNYQFMVDRACDQRLDGYRELGAKAAAAENERDKLRAEVARLREERDHYRARVLEPQQDR